MPSGFGVEVISDSKDVVDMALNESKIQISNLIITFILNCLFPSNADVFVQIRATVKLITCSEFES